MTNTTPPDPFTVDVHTVDGYLLERDCRPHSPWYAHTPSDGGGRTYLGCASTWRHAMQLVARHRVDTATAAGVPTVPAQSTSSKRSR